MSDQDRRLYTVAAFITGVLFTIGVDRICWYWRWQHHRQAAEDADGSTTPQRRVGPPRRTGTVLGKAQEENELEEQIAQGIEGCIGNTPLIRIKSLSDATNCDILCKAEFLNGAGGSPKDRVALSIVKKVRYPGCIRASDTKQLFPGRGVGSRETLRRRCHLRRHGGVYWHIPCHAVSSKRISCSYMHAGRPIQGKVGSAGEARSRG